MPSGAPNAAVATTTNGTRLNTSRRSRPRASTCPSSINIATKPPTARKQQTPRPSPTLTTLPTELIDLILSHLPRPSLKPARLTHPSLLPPATSRLFTTARLHLHPTSMSRLVALAASPHLRPLVRSLVLLRSPYLPASSDDAAFRAALPPPLNALPPTPLRALRNRYETDRDAEREHLEALAAHLPLRAPGSLALALRAPAATATGSAWERRVFELFARFEDALRGLPRLGGVVAEMAEGQEVWWRGVGLRAKEMEGPRRKGGVLEGFAVLYVLRVLGWRARSGGRGVGALRLCWDEGVWCGPAALGVCAWFYFEGLGKAAAAAEGEQQRLGGDADADVQVGLVHAAFAHLSRLDIEVRYRVCEDGEPHAGQVMWQLAKDCLGAAQALEHLRLILTPFSDDDGDGGGIPVEEDCDIFKFFTGTWPRLRELELGICTTEESLTGMLGRVAPTLRRLRLSGSMLLAGKGSWPGVFRRMRTVQWGVLEEVDCWDLRDMDVGVVTERKYFTKLGSDGCDIYDGGTGGRAVRNWVLERSDMEPEWDERTILRNHMAVCEECTWDSALQVVTGEMDRVAVFESVGWN